MFQVLLSPHSSEKAARGADVRNQHVFRVAEHASKREIKESVEFLFNVKVTSVRVMNVKGKHKRFGRIQGRRPNWRKAVVRLAQGYDINFAESEG